MKLICDPSYHPKRNHISAILAEFTDKGKLIYDGRNQIKTFRFGNVTLSIKSFRKPNLINKVVYRFFRDSKAERSFKYAQRLLEKGIGTPHPVAYAEEKSFLFGKSFYVSEHIDYEITFRELVKNPDLQDHEEILRAFTRFTWKMHENDILFLDHSPGNTLIKKNGSGGYDFFLVDLNRMEFRTLNLEERIRNFNRLTPKREMVEVMADEYSKLIHKPKSEVFEKMWDETEKFQERFQRKKRLKRKLKLKKS